MGEDRFTTVSSQSWFSRIGESIKGILVGGLLFFVSFPLLFWNEGRAVKRYKTLKEGAGVVVSVPAGEVNAQNEGKLVHVTGKADTGEKLADPKFGVSAAALKLRRNAEMFQWQERTETRTEKKLGGGEETITDYFYDKGWAGRRIDSSQFAKPEGHGNPASMPWSSDEFIANEIRVGAFKLPDFLVGRINNFTSLPVGADAAVPPALGEKAAIHGDGFYIGGDPAAPAVGDVRVSFEAVLPGEVSLIAQQIGDTFGQYATKAGGTVELLQTGVHGAEEMFQQAQQSNKIFTWVLRFAGFIVMGLGLGMVLKPLSVLADVVPFIGNIVGAGLGFIAFLVAAVFSLVTIAIAWVTYRPLIGIPLLVAAGAIAFLAISRMRKAKAKSAPAAPAAA